MAPSNFESARSEIERQMAELAKLKEAYALVEAHMKALGSEVAEEETTLPASTLDSSRPVKTPLKLPIPPVAAYGSKSEQVRRAIKAASDTFTARDLAEWLNNEGVPISSQDVSFILSRFNRSRVISEVTKGSGKSPSIFSKIPPPSEAGNLPVGINIVNRAIIEWISVNGPDALWEITKGVNLPIDDVERALKNSGLFNLKEGRWELAE